MRVTKIFLVAFLFIVLCFVSCEEVERIENGVPPFFTKEEMFVLNRTLTIRDRLEDYAFTLAPPHFGGRHIKPEMGTLGRVLFYDKNLSKDGTISCASCHKQSLAFSDDKAFSTGIHERKTSRNSIAFGSFPSFSTHYGTVDIFEDADARFFWDERVGTLAEQMRQTIANENEMGMKMHEVVEKISGLDYYEILFKRAFHSPGVSEDRIFQAIEAFINSIVATKSQFDRALVEVQGLDFYGKWPKMSPEESDGKDLFIANCASCHASSLSARINARHGKDIRIANNGLDVSYQDKGVGQISDQQYDYGVFKVPSLRNIELTGPYMHDGRFESLDEVVDFYSSGIQPHTNLHPELKDKDGLPVQMNFDEEEKEHLLRFLQTLTDPWMIHAPKWSDPFKK